MRIGILGGNVGSSFYRVLQPMQDLAKTGVWVDMLKPPVSVGSLVGYDIVYIHKPCEKQHLSLIDTAHSMDIKVWVDHDDDLWNVPVDHMAYSVYEDKQTITLATQMADIITVSTEGMKKAVEANCPGHKPIIVVENYVPFDDSDKPKNDFVVAWRGGRSHPKELDKLAPTLNEIAKTEQLYIIGIGTPLITEKHTFQGLLPPNNYIQYIRALAPSVFINYWDDIPFNWAKSDIFWREATAVGGAVIHKRGFEVMADDSYDKECFYLYDDFEEIPALVRRLKNDKNRKRLVNHSHEALKDSREKAIGIRYAITQFLCGKLNDELKRDAKLVKMT